MLNQRDTTRNQRTTNARLTARAAARPLPDVRQLTHEIAPKGDADCAGSFPRYAVAE